MDKYNLWELYNKVEHKIIHILSEMEQTGILLNSKQLKETDEKIKELLKNEKKPLMRCWGKK